MQNNSERITEIAPVSLRAHKKNHRYVKDIVGDEWELFLDDITERGIVQPLIVTLNDDKQTYTVISGHQRLRAAQHLQMSSVPCLVFEYSDDRQAEEDLIRINAMQRHYTTGEKYKLTAYLLEKAEDRRKTREHTEDGTFTTNHSVHNEQNGEAPKAPRDQIIKQVPGITVHDISNIKKLATMPAKEAQPLYDWIDEHNPSKKRIRERIRELEEKLKEQTHAKKGAQRRFNDLKKDYERLNKEHEKLTHMEVYEDYKRNPHHANEARNFGKLLQVLERIRITLRDDLGYLDMVSINDYERRMLNESNITQEIYACMSRMKAVLEDLHAEERIHAPRNGAL